MTTMKRLHVKLDPETHRLMKVKAASEDLTIQAYVTHLLKQAVYSTPKT